MLPPHPGVRKERFGCCAQGLVFPRAKAPRVVEYLNAKQSGQIDLMLDDLAREDKLNRYALYPVQVQHIVESRPKFRKRYNSARGPGGLEHDI
ncbi:hypothetical protein D6C85_05309 [Aureobasidium pullulans]|uniref:Uncharacterized protein n=1 Tax=Aureobasidium pullulans TaxID=5580 RepID=A0A4S9WZJ9_AURPU|nr:hypothetical protein D6C85_05309 [Aureobasidium pullulans]